MNTLRSRSTSLVLGCLAMLCLAASARAGTSADVSAELGTTGVPAGGRGMVAVVIDVHDGLHAQSHHPGNEDYIPLEIKAEPAGAVTAGEVRYPPGKDENYPQLGHLNVYVGRVVAYLPVSVGADAKPGPVKLAGTVELQACNSSSCFPPESVPFEVTVDVVAAGTAVRPNHPELFVGPDAIASPTTAPTTAPAAMPPAAPPAKASATPPAAPSWA